MSSGATSLMWICLQIHEPCDSFNPIAQQLFLTTIITAITEQTKILCMFHYKLTEMIDMV